MNFFGNYSFGFIFVVIALVHFVRRRPEGFWLWIIIFGGGLGALVYIVAEVIPDAGLLRDYFHVVSHRKRIRELEGMVQTNPSAGNYEELADLYLEQKKYARAKECYDRAISSRTDSPDPFYRRAICEMELGDYQSAVPDLERVVAKDPRYDFQRAPGLLAHAYAETGQPERATALFDEVTRLSTLSETQYNYASFLAAQGRQAEAREWAQRVLSKKASMPRFMKRRERPWFRKAAGLLKKLPAGATAS